MDSFDVYSDISTRTKGDLFVGVVGPVRVGKSTFITKFMEKFVLQNIDDATSYNCTLDELPQSADGVSIMTTQPKFVPANSVRVNLGNTLANVRLIDCVGYFVNGAKGQTDENGNPRMVKTPWSDKEIPLIEAAEIGTKRVITEHCNIAILLSADGSFSPIKRTDYEVAESRLVAELKQTHKPFVVVINSVEPESEKTQSLVGELQEKYGVGVLAVDVENLNEENVESIFSKILQEFPVVKVDVNMPKWLTALPFEHPIISEVASTLKQISADLRKVGDLNLIKTMFASSDFFMPLGKPTLEMGNGTVSLNLVTKENLFYQVLSEQCGIDIKSDFELIAQIKSLANAKLEWDKIKSALVEVKENGYGVVEPTFDDLILSEPQIAKLGGNRFGVKLKATAPSLHIMRVDVETEINPMIGSEQQSKDLVNYLTTQANENPKGMWETNMFGRTLFDLVKDGLSGKINSMPQDAQKKMRKALGRIVNEGKGGLICILL